MRTLRPFAMQSLRSVLALDERSQRKRISYASRFLRRSVISNRICAVSTAIPIRADKSNALLGEGRGRDFLAIASALFY